MNSNGFHLRDRIDIDPEFVAYVESLGIPKGTTLTLVGREVRISGGTPVPPASTPVVTFTGYNLTIVADTISGSSGLLVKTLDDAGTSAPGRPGHAVTILCRQLGSNITVLTPGGKGGPGTTGKTGTKGKDGAIDASFKPPLREPGGPGGAGGPGGPGAAGGKGGPISLRFVDDTPSDDRPPVAKSLVSPGGAGGAGGKGGRGGPGGIKNGPQGPSGKAGAPGANGAAGPVQAVRVTEDQYWNEARTLAPTWAEHRLRAAGYYFRSYRPAGRGHYLGVAQAEADAVLRLNPSGEMTRTATNYRNFVENNLNVLGLERDYSLIPDFEYYRRIMADYEPQIRQIFGQAGALILTNLSFTSVQKTLVLQQQHLAELAAPGGVLQSQLAEAQAGKKLAESDKKSATARVDEVKKRIKDLEFSLSTVPPPELADGIPLMVGVVAGAVATIAIPAAGPVVGGLLPYAADYLGGAGVKGDVKSMVQSANDLRKEIDKADKESKGLIDYAKDPTSWGKFAGPASKVVISFAKVIQELDGAKLKDPRQVELRSSYRELVGLTHQQWLAQLRFDQAGHAEAAAQAAIRLANNDRSRVEATLAQLKHEQQSIKAAALTVVQTARAAQDLLLQYVFMAARALEIYTLSYPPRRGALPNVDLEDNSGRVNYAYGYLHPDVEADYRDGKIDHVQFIRALNASMPTIESLRYLDAYTSYRARGSGLGPGSVYTAAFNRTAHPTVIAEFQKSGTLFFSVRPEDLPSNRYEAKVTSVRLKLSGVTAGPSFSCLVKHGGRSTQRWLPASSAGANPPIAVQVLRPSVDAVVLRRSEANQTTYAGEAQVIDPGQDQQIVLRCWGRGVAADWTVSVERDAGGRVPIDLSKVAAIEVEIAYDSFLHTAAAKQASATPRPARKVSSPVQTQAPTSPAPVPALE
jgi:hypothetical protein